MTESRTKSIFPAIILFWHIQNKSNLNMHESLYSYLFLFLIYQVCVNSRYISMAIHNIVNATMYIALMSL